MVRDPLDLRRYTKIEDSDDLTQALVEEIIEKCLGFEVEQRSLVWGKNQIMCVALTLYPPGTRHGSAMKVTKFFSLFFYVVCNCVW
ncbi:hypothetical protein JHK82_035083 [Glycine max]|nr:hypothetical protein JHK82_035083 [Glycine max]KAG5129086.1 hypothetical protein JHK84_035483 [Glycine max]